MHYILSKSTATFRFSMPVKINHRPWKLPQGQSRIWQNQSSGPIPPIKSNISVASWITTRSGHRPLSAKVRLAAFRCNTQMRLGNTIHPCRTRYSWYRKIRSWFWFVSICRSGTRSHPWYPLTKGSAAKQRSFEDLPWAQGDLPYASRS